MKPKLLIVDDEASAQKTLQALLLKQGYTLSFAGNGPEALATLPESGPDVILLDVMMPEMDGFELCRQIKSTPQWQHIPVIMITALDSKTDLARGLEAGADDFISKPVDKLELRARIRSMLRLKAQYDQLATQQVQLTAAFEMNQRSGQVIAQHLEALELLHELGLRLIKDLNTDSVLNLIAETALEIIPEATGCVMHFTPGDNGALLPVVFSAPQNTKLTWTSVGLEQMVGQAIQAGRPLTFGEVRLDTGQDNSRLETLRSPRSLLITPLVENKAALGAMTLVSPTPGAFSETHAHLMSILSNQAAIALDRACTLEEQVQRNGQEKRLIKELFQRYVSPPVVDRLVTAREEPVLGGKQQQVTILFADIRGFTSFSESLEPERLVEILNRYLALAVNAIVAQGGTLDKIMGDAVMAIFNAPISQSEHTRRAVRAALTMQQAIANYNRQSPRHPELSFGIGVHVGPAVVGNVGTVQRMNYTAIGDTVNLAWRLQENARGGEIILSEAAYTAVEKTALAEALGPVTVKGRQSPTPIFSLKGLIEADSILPNPIIEEMETP